MHTTQQHTATARPTGQIGTGSALTAAAALRVPVPEPERSSPDLAPEGRGVTGVRELLPRPPVSRASAVTGG
ncbi:hypothetical protein EEB14_45920 [Rhodococcus sp. WS4]|nr:hypothetical protein EEB14_45920 [Rhodococcus sp. WS4]